MGKSVHSVRLYVAIILGVAAGQIAFRALGATVGELSRDRTRSPLDPVLLSGFSESSEGKELSSQLGKLSYDAARDSGFALGQRGLVRLSDGELLEHAAVMVRVYERLDPASCRAITLGTADRQTMTTSIAAALNSLDESTRREYGRRAARAALAEVRWVGTPSIGDPDDVAAAITHITAPMSDTDRAHFIGTLERPATYTDADVCSATIELLRGISQMQPEKGGRFYRALLVAAAEESAKR